MLADFAGRRSAYGVKMLFHFDYEDVSLGLPAEQKAEILFIATQPKKP